MDDRWREKLSIIKIIDSLQHINPNAKIILRKTTNGKSNHGYEHCNVSGNNRR